MIALMAYANNMTMILYQPYWSQKFSVEKLYHLESLDSQK